MNILKLMFEAFETVIGFIIIIAANIIFCIASLIILFSHKLYMLLYKIAINMRVIYDNHTNKDNKVTR